MMLLAAVLLVRGRFFLCSSSGVAPHHLMGRRPVASDTVSPLTIIESNASLPSRILVYFPIGGSGCALVYQGYTVTIRCVFCLLIFLFVSPFLFIFSISSTRSLAACSQESSSVFCCRPMSLSPRTKGDGGGQRGPWRTCPPNAACST